MDPSIVSGGIRREGEFALAKDILAITISVFRLMESLSIYISVNGFFIFLFSLFLDCLIEWKYAIEYYGYSISNFKNLLQFIITIYISYLYFSLLAYDISMI